MPNDTVLLLAVNPTSIFEKLNETYTIEKKRDKFLTTTGQSFFTSYITRPRYLKEVTSPGGAHRR